MPIKYYTIDNGALEGKVCSISDVKEGYYPIEELAKIVGISVNRLIIYFFPGFIKKYERETGEKIKIQLIRKRGEPNLIYYNKELIDYILKAKEVLRKKDKENYQKYKEKIKLNYVKRREKIEQNSKFIENFVSFNDILKQLKKEYPDQISDLRNMAATLVLNNLDISYKKRTNDIYIERKDVEGFKKYIMDVYLKITTKKIILNKKAEEHILDIFEERGPTNKDLEKLLEEERI